MQAVANLDNKVRQPSNTSTNTQNTLYIHWQHHPKGLQRADIRMIYKTPLQPHLSYKKMQIAISRSRNLRDILTKTAILNAENMNIPGIIWDINITYTN